MIFHAEFLMPNNAEAFPKLISLQICPNITKHDPSFSPLTCRPAVRSDEQSVGVGRRGGSRRERQHFGYSNLIHYPRAIRAQISECFRRVYSYVRRAQGGRGGEGYGGQCPLLLLVALIPAAF